MQIYVQESRECCSLDIPVHELVKLVTDAIPNMAGMTTVVSSLIPIM